MPRTGGSAGGRVHLDSVIVIQLEADDNKYMIIEL